VTCDTAPFYFALNELAVGDYRTFAKLSPPLRAEKDRLAVAAAVADGTIDAVASDHAPHDQDSKRLPYAQAAAGAIGLETLLGVTLELVHGGRMGLAAALARMTSAPAGILGLQAGRLAKGAAADLVLFDPDRAWRVREAEFRSKSKNSPFDGRPLQGRVLRTLVNGETIFRREE
jgi:dihydroorotase